MIRAVVAIAALTLGAGVVLAQSDPAAQRSALMKENGKNEYGVLNRMVRDQIPYDQAAVDAALNQLEDTAKKLPTLWPDTAKTSVAGGDYSSSPKVWENKADFDAHIVAFTKAVADAKTKFKDLPSLKANYQALNGTCNGCHETYRVKKG